VGGGALTAVYSRTSRDYVRVQNPDGSFQQEGYVFKEGGNFGGPRVDATMDRLSFDDISKVLAGPLSAQGYVQSEDPMATKLLILVYWGTTIVPDDLNPRDRRESVQLNEQAHLASDSLKGSNGVDAAVQQQHLQSLAAQSSAFSTMEASQDAQTDAASANILGYTDEIYRTPPRDPRMATLKEEVERDRYYVVLLAYDYLAARRFGRHDLLWETRFSIQEQGNDFEKAFPLMASIAGKYFGQESHGLIHTSLEEGHVEVGEPKSLGTVPDK
jgi:hypothetical protein